MGYPLWIKILKLLLEDLGGVVKGYQLPFNTGAPAHLQESPSLKPQDRPWLSSQRTGLTHRRLLFAYSSYKTSIKYLVR